jgi:hypothetical protein
MQSDPLRGKTPLRNDWAMLMRGQVVLDAIGSVAWQDAPSEWLGHADARQVYDLPKAALRKLAVYDRKQVGDLQRK